MTLLEEVKIRYGHEIYEATYTLLVYKYAKRKKLYNDNAMQSLALNFHEHNYCASILKPMLESNYDDEVIDRIIETQHKTAEKNYKKWLKDIRKGA